MVTHILRAPNAIRLRVPIRLLWQSSRKSAFLRGSLLPTVAVTAIASGYAAKLIIESSEIARLIWLIALIGAGLPVVWQTVRNAFAGKFNSDLVASLAIVTAAVINQPLAGLVIVTMQTGGEALERFAERRASRAVHELEESAPRIAHLIVANGQVTDVSARAVRPGDKLLIRPGELIPCDGVVESGSSDLDRSQLTGEPMPVSAVAGTSVMSGEINLQGVLNVRATALAAESQYERIVELVRTAQASKAPLQRLADRYAVWFTPLTILVCALTFFFSRSWVDVLSVLVVATPCPLILAAPVAIIGGINRAARAKIIVRNGAALESLSLATMAVFDKTGTLTIGKPAVQRVIALPGFTEDQVFLFAAAVENGSGHLLARVIVDRAKAKYPVLPVATEHNESAGAGVTGMVSGVSVAIGGRAFVAEHATTSLEPFVPLERIGHALRAYVLLSGTPAGVIEFADSLRPELLESLEALRDLGFSKRVLLSGDSSANAVAVGKIAGINEVHGGLLPIEKAALVTRYRTAGEVVMMVGDGTNDAPALSTANVGVALSGHGGGITAEAADVVILADDLAKVPQAVAISRRTMRLARQSIAAGLGLSAVAMLFAATGFIAPTQGALLQEAIDVAVILNALRASWS